MSEFSSDANGCSAAVFEFSEDFIGFGGHFPQQAVLPGVCKIQAVLAICEKAKSSSVRLHEVVLSKFFKPATCGQKLLFKCVETVNEQGRYRVKASVLRGDEQIAKVDLLISYEQ